MLTEPITFTGSPLDRAGNQRRDPAWLAQRRRHPQSRFMPVYKLRALIDLDAGPDIAWLSGDDVRPFLDQGAACLLLGAADGACHFAVDVSAADSAKSAPFSDWGKFIDVRSIAGQLPAGHAAILAQARSMIDWHDRHGFCANCGHPTEITEAGYMRSCPIQDCKAQHFPRTDPVVIMLVERGDNCLLGRQPRFPKEVFSALAGFMEPGESIEEAVRREIMEEAGLPVDRVRYIASQHWPFPSSLMIGCIGETEASDITIDTQELEEARWFSRAEIAAMVEAAVTQEGLRMPPPLSLAHQLAERWLAGL